MPVGDFVGLKGPEYEVDIERGHIRRFGRAMNATVDEFMEGRHPVIPAVYLISAPYTWGYSFERPRGTVFKQIDHDLSVSLHAEEAFEFYGALPRAGDRLIAQASLENVKVKSGGRGGTLTFLTMLTRYTDMDRVLKVEQRSTSLTTENEPDSGDWAVNLPQYDPEYKDADPVDIFTAIARKSWDELEEGQGPGKVDGGLLLLREIVRFQGVVGEDDALHHDMAWARKLDYPSTFGLGTHQSGMLAGYAAHWLNPTNVRSFRTRFLNIFWPGNALVYEGIVERKYRDEADNPMVDVLLTCSRTDGIALVKVWMSLQL